MEGWYHTAGGNGTQALRGTLTGLLLFSFATADANGGHCRLARPALSPPLLATAVLALLGGVLVLLLAAWGIDFIASLKLEELQWAQRPPHVHRCVPAVERVGPVAYLYSSAPSRDDRSRCGATVGIRADRTLLCDSYLRDDSADNAYLEVLRSQV